MATPRKPAARKAATSKPRPIRSAPSAKAGPVHFNVDTFEREEVAETFAAVIGGKRIEMIDPQEMDWREVQGIDDPETFADLAVPAADKDTFLKAKMSVAAVNALMDAYMAHYGLGSAGNAAG